MTGLGLAFGKMGKMGSPGVAGEVEAAPNLIANSNTFNGAGWQFTDIDVPTTGVADPDGGNDAWLMVDDAGGGSGPVRLRYSFVTVELSTPHVQSIWVDPAGVDWFYMAYSAGGIIAVQYFDLLNGVPGVVENDVDSAIMTPDGDFYRCEMRFITDSIDNTALIDFRLALAEGNTTVPLDGTSSVNIWRAKLEAGLAATPWIDG